MEASQPVKKFEDIDYWSPTQPDNPTVFLCPRCEHGAYQDVQYWEGPFSERYYFRRCVACRLIYDHYMHY